MTFATQRRIPGKHRGGVVTLVITCVLCASGHAIADTTLRSNTASQVTGPPVRISASAAQAAAGSSDSNDHGLPQILGDDTGSLDVDAKHSMDDIQPWVVLDREQIETSGARNLEDLLRTRLTMNYVPMSAAQQPVIDGNRSTIALRGSSAANTLILVDGRRPASIGQLGSEMQSDVNAIPLSTVDRVEILPMSAAAIYGGNASAGIVNIVRRHDYSGLEAELTYGNTFQSGGSTRQVGLSGGLNLGAGRTVIAFSGSYAQTDPLLARDRSYALERYESALQQINYEDPHVMAPPPLGTTTNIRSAVESFDLVTGASLGLLPLMLKNGTPLNALTTHVPVGYAGASADGGAAFIDAAGHFSPGFADTAQGNGGGRTALLNGPTVASLEVSARQQLSAAAEMFVEMSAARNHGNFPLSRVDSTFFLDPSAPNNPFQELIEVTTPAAGADGSVNALDRAWHGLAGLIVRLPAGWKAEAEYGLARTDTQGSFPGNRLSDAVTSGIMSGEIDVLRDTNIYPIDLSPGLQASSSRVLPSHAMLWDVDVRLGGNLGVLPAGRPTLMMAAEHWTQAFSESAKILNYYDMPPTEVRYDRSSKAANSISAEVQIPVLSGTGSQSGRHLLDAQLAVRYDGYQVVGSRLIIIPPDAPRVQRHFSSTDSLFGLRFAPWRDIVLRASYGTGFVPPGVDQLQPNPPFGLREYVPFADPKRGGEIISAMSLRTGGNPNLGPEKTRSVAAGVVLTPRVIESTRVSLDWCRIDKRQGITSVPFSQGAFGLEDTVPGLVIRAPVSKGDPYGIGPIIGFDSSLRNATHARYESVDLALDHEYHTRSSGSWQVQARLTRLLTAAEEPTIAMPAVDKAGSFAAPRSAAGASLFWNFRSVTLGWTSQFLDSYWLDTSHAFSSLQGSARVPSIVDHDIFARYRWDEMTAGRSGSPLRLEVLVGVRDLFNSRPRFSTVAGSYDSDTWTSPLMATYYVTLRAAL